MDNLSNWYPSDILAEKNEFRSIRILVKEQESLGAGVDELKKRMEATVGDVMEVLNSITDKNKPSDRKKQRQLQERTKKLLNAKTVYGIALPLPNELSDSQSHQWEKNEGFVGTIGKSLSESEFGFGSVRSSVNKALGELASRGGFRKPIVDPGYFQDYGGTEPREFSFSWDLVPNSAQEAHEILDILYNLKKFTLPTSTISGMTMLSPYIFDIEIGNPRINALMNMNNVVCQSMKIDYSAEGALQFFVDGTPKYIKLEMTFAERTTVTADLY